MASTTKNRKRSKRTLRSEYYVAKLYCLPWGSVHKDETIGWRHKHPSLSVRLDYSHDMIPVGSTITSVRDHTTNFQYT